MAFVENPRYFPSNSLDPNYAGVSLRDQMAMEALAAIVSRGVNTARSASAVAFDHADAFMAERARRSPEPLDTPDQI